MLAKWTAAWAVAAFLGAPLSALAAQTLVAEDFEAPFFPMKKTVLREGAFQRTGALPDGWQDNSEWGDAHVDYSPLSEAHGGRQALRIRIAQLGGKAAVQLVRRNLDVRKGQIYSFSIALRSPDSLPVEIGLRQAGQPYDWSVRRSIDTTPEWSEWQFVATATRDDPTAILILRIGRTGVVDVDDVRVEAISADEYRQAHPPRPGNLLESTRFPLGPSNGWTLPRGDAYTLAPAPGETGPSGAPPLRVASESADGVMISPPMPLRPGQPHAVSFYARAVSPGARIQAVLRMARFRESANVAAKTFEPTAEWQRFSFGGTAPFSDNPGYLAFTVRGTVLLDAVQVEEGGEPTDYAAARDAVEVCAVPARDYGLFFECEPLEFRLAATGHWPERSRVRARIVDLNDQAEDLPDVALGASPFFGSIRVAPGRNPLGAFRLELQPVDAAGKAIGSYGEAVAFRLLRPRFPNEDRPDSRFGIHILATEKQAKLAQELGFKWIRCHDAAAELTKWFYVEPERGQWRWSDDRVDILRRHNLMILGTLDTSPPWASRVDPKVETNGYRIKCYTPKDLDAWAEYCKTIVARYRGKIDYWEIWNEPYYEGFYRDIVNGKIVHATPQQFAGVVERAYNAAHAANPDCTVLTAVGTVPDWTEGCVESGAASFADLFTHHHYTPQLAGGPDDVLARGMAAWRAKLPEDLRAKVSWDSEGGPGVESHTFYSQLPVGGASKDARFYADFVARYYVSAAALGVPKFFLYTFHGHSGLGNPSFSVMDGDGTLEPLAAAVSALAWEIEGKRFVEMAPLSDTAWAYAFSDGETSVAAIVNQPGKTHRLPAVEGAQCRDLCGNPISLPATVGPETCYVSRGGDPRELLAALKGARTTAPRGRR